MIRNFFLSLTGFNPLIYWNLFIDYFLYLFFFSVLFVFAHFISILFSFILTKFKKREFYNNFLFFILKRSHILYNFKFYHLLKTELCPFAIALFMT